MINVATYAPNADRRYRLVVTGPREYSRNPEFVGWGLNSTTWLHSRDELVVIHGGATGVDSLARKWAEDYGCAIESYPYPHLLGRAGGPIRNRYMLGLGADELFAFLEKCTKKECERNHPHWSHGTMDCIGQAMKLHIPVRFHWENPEIPFEMIVAYEVPQLTSSDGIQ